MKTSLTTESFGNENKLLEETETNLTYFKKRKETTSGNGKTLTSGNGNNQDLIALSSTGIKRFHSIELVWNIGKFCYEKKGFLVEQLSQPSSNLVETVELKKLKFVNTTMKRTVRTVEQFYTN